MDTGAEPDRAKIGSISLVVSKKYVESNIPKGSSFRELTPFPLCFLLFI